LLIRIDGFPYLPLTMDISLKFNPFLKPEPNAFENASLAANLLEKKETLFFFFFDSVISSSEYILFK